MMRLGHSSAKIDSGSGDGLSTSALGLDILGVAPIFHTPISAGKASRARERGDLMSLFMRGEPTDLEADLTSLFKREATDLDEAAESEVGAEIREFARLNVARPHQAPQADRELVTKNISALLQRVAGCSVAEIDRLMSELQTLRDLLHSEGARVQRQIAVYANLNQSVVQSTKIISESLAKSKKKNARAG